MAASPVYLVIDAVVIVALLGGVAVFRTPHSARRGTLAASLGMVLAVAAVLVRMDVNLGVVIAVALVVGSALGLIVAARVSMIGIPAMIAFQHGAGALAALLVSFVELSRGAEAGIGALPEVAGLAGLVVGGGTLSASLIASGKLANLLSSRPLLLKGHGLLLLGLSLITLALAVLAGFLTRAPLAGTLVATAVAAILVGIVGSIRIGGADMPVLISTLNATAGFAAAFCGIILGSYLLVAAGATVAASGSVLTQVMCKAMNRNLLKVFAGMRPAVRAQEVAPAMLIGGAPASAATDFRRAGTGRTVEGSPAAVAAAPTAHAAEPANPHEAAAHALQTARRAIIIPGYGMALAQAQFELVSLARKLEQIGVEVKYAIHPVAGRMPGHMNVLLAEADVPYDRLVEMDAINSQFAAADVALVVGACDVVNPAAIETPGTPISGMPILRAMDAQKVVVCNYDDKPGYSGVHNPLYGSPRSILLWGDAKESLERLNELVRES